ncbi:predicted protein [Naegleria gruberi]|uniref:Predicted protein n=1 Tax=Naegleria gruberi TaxID=5762 RepID=D2VZ29_NAEGR|nr:uncharacterized protein NAEGRDRAFT_53398 [Naegleria gruberi]EFC37872.1 predicted protein [Naegleria gruberi]|eukprot:XP_002670616.1 predicted protein [Naegleria gruberi strain NEG-M]
MTDKASMEEIFGSDFEEESEEEQQQQQQNEEIQSSSDNEVEEFTHRRVTRSSEHQKIAEKERLEEEQRKLEDQMLTSQAEHYDSLLYKYDSDGDDESKQVLEVKHSERPTKDSLDLFFLRTPIQFNTDEKEFTEESSLPKNDLYTIRWKKNEETGEIESNTRVVQYEDGSYQVFVGNEVILNLEAKKYTNYNNLHLFEKVSPFCYYGHGIFTHRLNSKATSTQTKGRDIALKLTKGTTTTKIKKTVLTSKRPETEETKKVMEEAQSLKKKQQKKQQKYQNTLTLDNASLEDAGSSSDEEGNVRKIKRNTLRKPKRSSYEDEEESADSASTGSDEESADSYSSDDSSRASKKRR